MLIYAGSDGGNGKLFENCEELRGAPEAPSPVCRVREDHGRNLNFAVSHQFDFKNLQSENHAIFEKPRERFDS